MELLFSYPENFAGIIDIVHIGNVVLQIWTELVKASAKVAILQMDQEQPKNKIHNSLDTISKDSMFNKILLQVTTH